MLSPERARTPKRASLILHLRQRSESIRSHPHLFRYRPALQSHRASARYRRTSPTTCRSPPACVRHRMPRQRVHRTSCIRGTTRRERRRAGDPFGAKHGGGAWTKCMRPSVTKVNRRDLGLALVSPFLKGFIVGLALVELMTVSPSLVRKVPRQSRTNERVCCDFECLAGSM